ncbi:tRNA uridine-5-carboxymethylaminomethyl(34) synthesis GTPase MnmE [Allomesorhizobium camelthorni]|uniref:tRNA modification GTPase MnmE n=1 Tax=Allomesorhizobium camelthorni TaxID=475069 RepID=A0A6G4W5D6_9HYPH|nr:tRNA uridine-5-carboxymethylaminomethyl(34) synthesis GTPase MnmE [Mesorhizobium camelthorni]NGO49961.1 tRNA uridine-5-carboxymethylaminomethyl(34) synthesis GTPase MnmE [Mesorhizobium camelthorni]
MVERDTIVALSSGRLPAGIAVVRISGPKTRFVIETITGSVPAPRSARYGAFADKAGTHIDSGITLFFQAPASFTGEDSAELHAHGGKAVVAALLDALCAIDGVRLAEAGEFTRRAFLNGKVDLLKAEALADLVSAETEAQRRFAVLNSHGGHKELYSGWRQRLIHARAMIEAEMDFSDEADVPGSVAGQIWTNIDRMSGEIRRHIAGFRRAEIIRDGFDVVILGAPNAGKSSLLNALAKRDAAIVTDEPGTTRDLIEVVLDLDGQKVRVTDTAGLREGGGAVEAIGIEKAIARARNADLVLLLEDMTNPNFVTELPAGLPLLRVGTKYDLLPSEPADPEFDLCISVASSYGLDRLLQEISNRAEAALGESVDLIPWRERHVALLSEALKFLESARSTEQAGYELRAEDLRLASERIGRISGAVDVEDLLDVIFSQFCIGK